MQGERRHRPATPATLLQFVRATWDLASSRRERLYSGRRTGRQYDHLQQFTSRRFDMTSAELHTVDGVKQERRSARAEGKPWFDTLRLVLDKGGPGFCQFA